MYTSSILDNLEYQTFLAAALEPLFQYVCPLGVDYTAIAISPFRKDSSGACADCRQNDVDVALWGHVHQYERTCGIVSNGVCGAVDEDGTVHGMFPVLFACSLKSPLRSTAVMRALQFHYSIHQG